VGLDHFALLETNLSVSTFAAGGEMVAISPYAGGRFRSSVWKAAMVNEKIRQLESRSEWELPEAEAGSSA
jgi:hypothetical protein